MKMGLKSVPGVFRVAVKKKGDVLFVVSQPEVFRSSTSNVYVIFGEAKIGDNVGDVEAQAQADEFLAGLQGTEGTELDARVREFAARASASTDKDKQGTDGNGHDTDGVDDDEDVDETGINPMDIDLVVQQADVSRARAVRALRNKNGDIVDAILELTL